MHLTNRSDGSHCSRKKVQITNGLSNKVWGKLRVTEEIALEIALHKTFVEYIAFVNIKACLCG